MGNKELEAVLGAAASSFVHTCQRYAPCATWRFMAWKTSASTSHNKCSPSLGPCHT